MQVVIDIDDNLYTRLFDNGDEYISDMRRACVAIRKGTPLPKGHGNLIYREDVESLFKNARKTLYEQSKKEQIMDFWTRENMLLNSEQIVHLIDPVISADKEGD
jgi:hypothetical protein